MLNLKEHHFHGTLSVVLVSAFLATMVVFITWGYARSEESQNRPGTMTVPASGWYSAYVENSGSIRCVPSSEVQLNYEGTWKSYSGPHDFERDHPIDTPVVQGLGAYGYAVIVDYRHYTRGEYFFSSRRGCKEFVRSHHSYMLGMG